MSLKSCTGVVQTPGRMSYAFKEHNWVSWKSKSKFTASLEIHLGIPVVFFVLFVCFSGVMIQWKYEHFKVMGQYPGIFSFVWCTSQLIWDVKPTNKQQIQIADAMPCQCTKYVFYACLYICEYVCMQVIHMSHILSCFPEVCMCVWVCQIMYACG